MPTKPSECQGEGKRDGSCAGEHFLPLSLDHNHDVVWLELHVICANQQNTISQFMSALASTVRSTIDLSLHHAPP